MHDTTTTTRRVTETRIRDDFDAAALDAIAAFDRTLADLVLEKLREDGVRAGEAAPRLPLAVGGALMVLFDEHADEVHRPYDEPLDVDPWRTARRQEALDQLWRYVEPRGTTSPRPRQRSASPCRARPRIARGRSSRRARVVARRASGAATRGDPDGDGEPPRRAPSPSPATGGAS